MSMMELSNLAYQNMLVIEVTSQHRKSQLNASAQNTM